MFFTSSSWSVIKLSTRTPSSLSYRSVCGKSCNSTSELTCLFDTVRWVDNHGYSMVFAGLYQTLIGNLRSFGFGAIHPHFEHCGYSPTVRYIPLALLCGDFRVYVKSENSCTLFFHRARLEPRKMLPRGAESQLLKSIRGYQKWQECGGIIERFLRGLVTSCGTDSGAL